MPFKMLWRALRAVAACLQARHGSPDAAYWRAATKPSSGRLEQWRIPSHGRSAAQDAAQQLVFALADCPCGVGCVFVSVALPVLLFDLWRAASSPPIGDAHSLHHIA
jgi:hypothetical protein